ncbi:MAG: hypothetical protein GTO02_14315 [Candidatus Dadabacteria bacterium]|nr:hypothetical protein [Candidatus Dadabacteria bacterium]
MSENKEEIQKVHVVNDGSPSTNIYYNVTIRNVVSIVSPNPAISIPKLANFRVNRADSILSQANNYRVCVSRFSIPTGLLPMFLFPKEEGFYTTTLSFNDGITIHQQTENVVYVPSNINDVYEEYQPIYYINTLLEYINTAFQNAFNVLSIIPGYAPTAAPFLTYDPVTKLFSLWAQEPYEDEQEYGIFMNKPLFDDFFSTFYSREVLSNLFFGFNGIQLLVKDQYTNGVTISGSPGFKMTQELSSVELFNHADRLVISTASMPINPTIIGTERQQVIPALQDYVLPDDSQTRTRYEYTPTLYRWVDLISNLPLRQIDLQVFIIYKNNVALPLYIAGNAEVLIQLFFTYQNSQYQ